MWMPLCQKQKHFFTPPIFLELPLMIKHGTNTTTFGTTLQSITIKFNETFTQINKR